MLRLIACALFALALSALSSVSQAQTAAAPAPKDNAKVALVIGIDRYEQISPPNPLDPKKNWLKRAVSDATAMTKLLKDDLRFDEVELLPETEATYQGLLDAWERLKSKVGKNSVLVFYFAGHGLELHGNNFLIANDAVFKTGEEYTLHHRALNFRQMLRDIGDLQVKTDALAIFILDACRNNTYKHPETAVIGGLAPIKELPKRVFVMYSAGIGQTALDKPPGVPDDQAKNSVYTTELLKLLPKQAEGKQSLAELAQVLRYEVYKAAKKPNAQGKAHYQTPAYYDQLLSRDSILGKSVDHLVVASTASSALSAEETRGLSDGDILKECLECPELRVIGPVTMELKDRTLKLERPLAVGRFEVTKGEWNACVDKGGCRGSRYDVSGGRHGDREPVSNVTWTDANDYVAWLNSTLKANNARYRLPTEQEWEIAARGGDKGDYSFSEAAKRAGKPEADVMCDYANGADQSTGVLLFVNQACTDKVGRAPAQVGSFLPNAYELFDMHGNVAEWVNDCWYPPADKSKPADCARRTIRGGSWRSGPEALSASWRSAVPPSSARGTLGFRVVRDLSDQE